jgi:hypothetical protein
MDIDPDAADLQDILDFSFLAPSKMRTPEGRVLYRLQFEQLKQRVNMANPEVQKWVGMTQDVMESPSCNGSGGGGGGGEGVGNKYSKVGKSVKRESGEKAEMAPKEDMTELELDALAAEIDAMGDESGPTKPKKGRKKKGK